MQAFKFLAAGARARFSELAWPQPDAQRAGGWVVVAGALEPCVCGVHACREQDLPYWLDSELWRIELDGALWVGESMVVAARGRLLQRVESWNDELKGQLLAFCVERAQGVLTRSDDGAQPRAERYLRDVEALGQAGELAAAAYVSALAAACGSALPELDAYVGERSVQARWLASRLA